MVGAYRNDDNGTDSGSAYVFRWNGISWVEEQILLPSDGAASDYFGYSVAISGNVALVGAYNDDDISFSSGSAYVFRWNGSSWVEEQKLLPSVGHYNDNFGRSVAINGDVALVGTHLDYNENSERSGAAYVFRWNGSSWVEEQKLLPSDGATGDSFGYSVAIRNNAAIVGAYGDDDNGSSSGSAYVFRWNGSTWVEEQKLLPGDGVEEDYFGRSVAIDGDLALVGAYGDDDNGSLSGSAYVYRREGNSWVEELKLLPSDAWCKRLFWLFGGYRWILGFIRRLL